MLQAALLGLENGYDLPAPETNDGLETINTDRHTPHSLAHALDALEADTVLAHAVGPEMITNFIAIKRDEVKIVSDRADADQLAYYLHYI